MLRNETKGCFLGRGRLKEAQESGRIATAASRLAWGLGFRLQGIRFGSQQHPSDQEV